MVKKVRKQISRRIIIFKFKCYFENRLFKKFNKTIDEINHIRASHEKKNASFLQRKEHKNQSILKVDFSNAINKINSEKRKEYNLRGEYII